MAQIRRIGAVALKVLLAGIAVWVMAPIAAMLVWAVRDVSSVPPEQERLAQYAAFISAHEEELLDAVRRTGAGKSVRLDGVMSIGKRGDAVEFLMHGSGFGSAMRYYGFYYSPEDAPLSTMGLLSGETDGEKWLYQTVGDNRGYTLRLRANWFYYEALF